MEKKSYDCLKCGKVLLSPAALDYHTKNLHVLKEISNEAIWVSKKVKEGKRGSGWQCCECSKNYTSQPALRAHLKLHYALSITPKSTQEISKNS